jgi:SAM-dependent methyltransferase
MADDVKNSEEAEIAALFVRLRDEIADREPAARPSQDRSAAAPASHASARTDAERFWAVTADRPSLYKPGRWGQTRGLLLAPAKPVLRKLMRWYIEPAFAQQRDFNSRVLGALDELSERIDMLAEQVERSLDGALETLGRSLEQLDRSFTELDERLLHVERRVRRQGQPSGAEANPGLSAPERASHAEPDYFAFESRMRGSSELIRERQTIYADEFRDAAPVLDIGCGRGEFLSLLREAGIEARGVDTNPDMVAHCLDDGLAVEQADGSAFLAGLGDDSLGGIFCAHLLEHLYPAAIFRLLELAVEKLRPGGLFVAETPNPLSLIALANFSADLSHNRPLHPSTLSFLARQAGFREVTLRFASEPAEDERLQRVPLPDEPGFVEAQQRLDGDVDRLNEVVFGPQDYAVLART